MTAETAPGQAGATSGGPAGPGSARQAQRSSLSQRMVWYWIWLAVVRRTLGDQRFQAKAITGAIAVVAFFSVVKNNQVRPVRRAAHWYMVKGEADEIKALRRGREALKSGKR